MEDQVKILELARKKDALLKHEEETMHLKIRAIWIKAGDNNTHFFIDMIHFMGIRIQFQKLRLRRETQKLFK